jgi:predicted dehydrogenase
MEKILRLGIIGLGRRWQQRYKPALRALRNQFAIRVVCDEVQERAAREAKQIGCGHAAGPTQLLERDDVDAVLLLARQWFGLWPVERARQFGKPVLCSSSLELDDAYADELHRKVRESRLPIMVELLPRSAPITTRLLQLFNAELGPPRFLLCDVRRSGWPAGRAEPAGAPEPPSIAGLFGGNGIALLDWCTSLLRAEPIGVTASSLRSSGFSSVFLEFFGGRGVQLLCRKALASKPIARLEALAERGSAVVEWPHQVSWSTQQGSYSHALRGGRPLTQALLERFREAVQNGRRMEPNLDDAYRLLRWLRLAARSQSERRSLPTTG